jgi:wobble nucleotide-excising tRNase
MKRVKRTITVVAALALGLVACPLWLTAQTADSEQINQLFAEARLHASNAEKDAELLESYTRSMVTWETHSAKLHAIRGHVNDLIRDFNRAKDLRAEASPWQQEAIDKIEPLLKSMADHLSATIDHLNDNQSKVRMPEYQSYVKANRTLAEKTANLIRDYVEYGESTSKVEELERKLQVSPEPGE